jgi:hypothetical protein
MAGTCSAAALAAPNSRTLRDDLPLTDLESEAVEGAEPRPENDEQDPLERLL